MVKRFDFPTYEEWKNSDVDTIRKYGDYLAGISTLRFNGRYHSFRAVISTDSDPLNFDSNKIVFLDLVHKDEDGIDTETKLKESYERIVDYLNAEFEKYLKNKCSE